MAETLTQTLRLVGEAEPVAPRLLNPSVPRDLETLCLKCLEKDPHRRYPTARELAQELGRFLANEPIHARPLSAPARAARWCSRKPWQAAAMALLLVVAVGSPIALWRINNARGVADNARRETQKQLYTALLEQARATVRSGELGQRVRTLDAVRRAAVITNSAELRCEVMAALALPDLRFERDLPTGPECTMVQLDPRFERLAICQGDGPVEIRSAVDGRRLATLPASTRGVCYLAKWSSDARFLAAKRQPAAAGEDASLEVWEVASGRRVPFPEDGSYSQMAFHPRLPCLMGGKKDGGLVLWDLEKPKEIMRFVLPMRGTNGSYGALIFSPDGQSFAAAYPDLSNHIVSVHQTAGGALIASAPFTAALTDLAWHPGGGWIVATDMNGFVHLVDSHTGQYRTLGRHKAVAATVVFSPDGRYFLTGGYEREIICWDSRTLERAFVITLNTFMSQFREGGSECALITKSACRIHSFDQPSAHREIPEGLRGQVRHAAFSPDARWLAVADAERLGVWDLAGDGPGALLSEGAKSRVFFSAADEFCTDYGLLQQVAPGTNASAPPMLRDLEWPVAEPVAATACAAYNVIALTSPTGSCVIPIENPASRSNRWVPTSSGFNGISPDGRWLAIFTPYAPVLHVYRVPGLEAVAHLTNELGIRNFDFSPQGDQVAVSTRDTVEIWSTATWQRTSKLTNFQAFLFAPEGRGWWLTSDFRSAGLYDSRTKEPLLYLPPGMLPLAVSQDGRFLAASVDARRLQVWDLVEVRRQFKDLGVDWERNE
jgi:WD40 repeat protein